MDLLVASKSNWGKSWTVQAFVEKNLSQYQRVVILDYKDEYGGLGRAGMCNKWPVGPDELRVGAEWWEKFFTLNHTTRLARYRLTDSEWREIAEKVAIAVRRMPESVLLVVDEAHFVAPQRFGYPEEIRGLATTGDGEGVSVIWVTQRLSELDKTPVSQSEARLLGGFGSQADLDKIKPVLEYPDGVHVAGGTGNVPNLPESLHAPAKNGEPGGPLPLRKFTNDEGQTRGSEWIWSDDLGTLKRIDTRTWNPKAAHEGGDRNRIDVP